MGGHRQRNEPGRLAAGCAGWPAAEAALLFAQHLYCNQRHPPPCPCSYFFISTFIDAHLAFHAQHLK